MTLALLFPGQGSQAVGMGAPLADAFASARDVFAEVDEALGQKLSVLMRETKKRLPTESKVTLLSEPGIAYEVLVSVMDAVRVDLTATGPDTVELFPQISLGDAPAAAGAKP